MQLSEMNGSLMVIGHNTDRQGLHGKIFDVGRTHLILLKRRSQTV